MRSIAKSKKRSKKTKCLGAPSVLRSDHYEAFDVDSKVECIRALIPLGLMHVQEVLETEACNLAGTRYARKTPDLPGRRHGSNPGSVQLAGQRHPLRIPRVQHKSGGEIPLYALEQLCGTGQVDVLLLKRVLYGISYRNYETAAAAVPDAIRLSSSTVARTFTRASVQQLKALQDRDLSQREVVAVFLDGKTFADMTMVMAVGITLTGKKHLLGFVKTGTENEAVLTPFLHSLRDRGLDISQGLLVIIDGDKGLRGAVQQTFGELALVQRCQWHKRENVIRYLPKGEQIHWRIRLHRAYRQPTYEQARTALARIQRDLAARNQSAVRSLAEGLEETLTLHRLGVFPVLGESFKTTNCLESINAAVEARCAKVDHWVNSSQRHRWLATALLDIEPRLRRVKGFRHLPKLRVALQRELKITQATRSKIA
ncbi:MAG: transposase [Nitrospirales bacterium]|nr:transposase [Nitrospirales bacterium]